MNQYKNASGNIVTPANAQEETNFKALGFQMVGSEKADTGKTDTGFIKIPTGKDAIGKQITIDNQLYPSQEWYDVNILGKTGGTTLPTTPTTGVTGGVTGGTGGSGATTIIDPNKNARDGAANDANSYAQTLFDSISDDDVETRDSSKILADLATQIADTSDKIPAPTSMSELFSSEKAKLGIEPLETELADLDAEIERINAELLVEAEKAGEQVISSREIGRAKGQLQKRADREIALLNIERSAVARQLNNKMNTLEMIMGFTQQDFENTSTYYSNQYKRVLDVYNLISDEEDKELTRTERAKNDAKANLTVIQNALREGNIDYATLTDDQKLKISQLEIQSGYPQGLTAKIKNTDPDKKVQTVTSRTGADGNVYYDILLTDKDGGMSVKSILKGKAASSELKTSAYWSAIDRARKDLREGKDWGYVWKRVQGQFSGVADAEIDSDIGKESEGVNWSEAGAYEQWKSEQGKIDPVLKTDLNDAISAINAGADKEAVKRRFLENHPDDGKMFDDYIGTDL